MEPENMDFSDFLRKWEQWDTTEEVIRDDVYCYVNYAFHKLKAKQPFLKKELKTLKKIDTFVKATHTMLMIESSFFIESRKAALNILHKLPAHGIPELKELLNAQTVLDKCMKKSILESWKEESKKHCKNCRCETPKDLTPMKEFIKKKCAEIPEFDVKIDENGRRSLIFYHIIECIRFAIFMLTRRKIPVKMRDDLKVKTVDDKKGKKRKEKTNKRVDDMKGKKRKIRHPIWMRISQVQLMQKRLKSTSSLKASSGQ